MPATPTLLSSMPSAASRPDFVSEYTDWDWFISQNFPLIVMVGVVIWPLRSPDVFHKSLRLGV